MKNNNIIGFFAVLILSLGFITSCSDSTSTTAIVDVPSKPQLPVVKTNEEHIEQLWQSTISQLLTESLWQARDGYDASHILMQPMQYAFRSSDVIKIAEFDVFFAQMSANFDQAKIDDDRVATAQFMLFISEYLVLQLQRETVTQEMVELYKKVQSWLVEFMYSAAWMWDREPFESILQRTHWKLNNKNFAFSYYKAMFDEDLHSYAVLANMSYLSNSGRFSTDSTEFMQLKVIGVMQIKQMLQQEIKLLERKDANGNSAWLFQPGVWWQHPEYQYVGNLALTDDLEPMPVEDIATDSSHMHRWPIWLKAYKRAFTDSETKTYITKLQHGLALQFNEKVYVAADQSFTSPRVNNFFDGHNGVYRYRFATAQNSGYGPYQLSAILYVGWYGNLEYADTFVTDIESLLNRQFQFTPSELATLVGPNTTRERHPLFVWPDYFTNGMAELNARISLSFLKQ